MYFDSYKNKYEKEKKSYQKLNSILSFKKSKFSIEKFVVTLLYEDDQNEILIFELGGGNFLEYWNEYQKFLKNELHLLDDEILLPISDLLHIFCICSNFIISLFKNGYFYTDLKPENMTLIEKSVKIIDLGDLASFDQIQSDGFMRTKEY